MECFGLCFVRIKDITYILLSFTLSATPQMHASLRDEPLFFLCWRSFMYNSHVHLKKKKTNEMIYLIKSSKIYLTAKVSIRTKVVYTN
jgi:hypothetical protein